MVIEWLGCRYIDLFQWSRKTIKGRGVMQDKWEFYKDGEKKWRWRRTASNGRIVGASTQGYVNKADCEANARINGWKG